MGAKSKNQAKEDIESWGPLSILRISDQRLPHWAVDSLSKK